MDGDEEDNENSIDVGEGDRDIMEDDEEDEEYKEIIQHPKMFVIQGGPGLKTTLDTWFAGDSAPRKLKILGNTESCEEENACV